MWESFFMSSTFVDLIRTSGTRIDFARKKSGAQLKHADIYRYRMPSTYYPTKKLRTVSRARVDFLKWLRDFNPGKIKYRIPIV
jgi:hypothetical protein